MKRHSACFYTFPISVTEFSSPAGFNDSPPSVFLSRSMEKLSSSSPAAGERSLAISSVKLTAQTIHF
ncbi:hypothetical protein QQF64_006855 [Cirrhinus molitorella]|uniref:Uncharacterized protein n=1 Tax=Cirrhinus molitorella TaxID=172907 RepID=A0ABR3M909_9TELE